MEETRGSYDSPLQAGYNMQGCMADKGWTLTIDEEGGLTSDIPVEQSEAYEGAIQECVDQFGYGQPLPPLSRDEADEYYEELLAVGDCVRNLGYTTPELPSRQSVLDSLMQPGRLPNWNPHEHLTQISSGEEREKVMEACPFPT